jgi:glycosyltransferase 2 family protein
MKDYIFKSIKLIFVLSVFYYLYKNNHIDLGSFIALKNNTLLNLFLLILILLTLLLGALRWFLILRYSKINIKFIQVFKIIYICGFFNNFMFGNIGGDVLRIYYATNLSTKNKVKNGFTILLDRFFGLIGLLCLGLISLLIMLIISKEYIFLLYLFFGILLAMFVFFALFFFLKKYKKFLNLMIFLNLNKKLFILGVLISIFLFFTVHISIFFISNFIFDFRISLNHIFLANFFSSLVGAIPITPGGIGVGEAAFVFINNNFFKIYLDNLANILIYYRILNLLFSLPSLYFFFRYKSN